MDTYNLPPMFSSALSPQSGALADDEAHRNHWIFDPFALFLIIMYLVAGTLSFFQLLAIYTSNHRLKTFQTGLLSLTMFMSFLRLVFWAKTMYTSEWDKPPTLFLFLFPNVLQFACFSLLAMYYVSVVHKPDWKKFYRKRYTYAYFATNVVLVGIIIGLCVGYSQQLDKWYLAYLGALDVLLGIMLVIYSFKFDRCLTYQKQLLPRSRNTFKIMNLGLVVIFFCRAIYAFLNSAGKLPSRQSVLDFNGDHNPVFWGVSMFFFITECFPLLTLVGLIWRVPKKQARSFSGTNSQYRHLQRGSTGPSSSSQRKDTFEEMSEAGGSDLDPNFSPAPSLSQKVNLSEPLLDDNVFSDMGRYDSPPHNPDHLLGGSHTSASEKFIVGSNTSSNDQRTFGNIQASFGSDTISPYDILTNYTNRRQTSRRSTASPGNRRNSNNLSTSAPRDLGPIDGKGEIVRPSSLGGGAFAGRTSATPSDTIQE
ncbi:hypothetical protein TrST_g7845 [Triparma strigata]|uniref:THH1/TOM1/TOM3 domain-containing protein n=1 Tax=Triparma strigata TaxID=1606541 RepID=A0A9W7EGG9_9STRA|nr:hypothetical protein TrST_g7845 [Triparma strigata]